MYELVPEVTNKFSSISKGNNQIFVEFVCDEKCLFDRWCASQNVDGDLQSYSNRYWRRSSLCNEVKTYLDEHKAETLQ